MKTMYVPWEAFTTEKVESVLVDDCQALVTYASGTKVSLEFENTDDLCDFVEQLFKLRKPANEFIWN